MKCWSKNEAGQLITPYLDLYSSVVAVAWDKSDRISYCNQAFLSLLQIESAPLGQNLADFLLFPEQSCCSSHDNADPVQLSVRLKSGLTDYRCNATVYCLDQGSLAFCEKPILLQSDFVTKLAELNQELANLTWELDRKNRLIEIANQTMAQEKNELQESEQRYRQLLEDANVIILTFDIVGQILYINDYGRFFFEYECEDLVGKNLFDTIVPTYDSKGNNLQAVFVEELAKTEVMQRHTGANHTRSGKQLWIDWTVRRLPKASVGSTEYMAIGVDVTAQRRIRTEEKLGHNRRQRSELFNEAIVKQLSSEALVAAARQIGVEIAERFACIVFLADEFSMPKYFATDPIERQYLQNRLIDCLSNEEGQLAWQTPAGIAVLQPAAADKGPLSPKQTVLLAAKAIERLKQFAPSLSFHCGVSHAAGGLSTLGELYTQALAAASYGPALLGLRAVYHWQELGAYQFVVRDIHSPMSTQFVEDQLGPILSLPSKNKQSEMLQTLEELVTHDSVEIIGNRLNIVSKTVRYRKRNLEKLLGVSLDSIESLSSLSLALKIRSITGAE